MLYIAADHAGYKLKESLTHMLATRSIAFEDFGTFSDELTDYPAYAKQVSKEVLKYNGRGILICGSGAGMTISANRHKGIRAAVAWNQEVAKRIREEDDANILCLPARLINDDQAWEIVSTFLSTTFAHLDRYKRRLKQIDA